jgi:hypothetical protein
VVAGSQGEHLLVQPDRGRAPTRHRSRVST